MYDYKWFKNIKKFSYPDDYNQPEGSQKNDVAVIELTENFEPYYVRPACLARNTDQKYEEPFMVSSKSCPFKDRQRSHLKGQSLVKQINLIS